MVVEGNGEELVLVVDSHSQAAVVYMESASVVVLDVRTVQVYAERDLRLLLISVSILRWWLLTTIILLSGKVRHCGGEDRVELS